MNDCRLARGTETGLQSAGLLIDSRSVTCGTAIAAPHGTNPAPVIPLDNLSPARAREPKPLNPRAQTRGRHARWWPSDAAVQCAEKLAGSAPGLAGNAPVRSGDLVCRAPPPHCDERGPHCRVTQRLVDDFRNVIRCCNDWTSKTLYLP